MGIRASLTFIVIPIEFIGTKLYCSQGSASTLAFEEDLRDHYYEYVQLRRSISELKTEKSRISTTGSTEYLTGLYQDFLKPYIEILDKSNPRNNPTARDHCYKAEKKLITG
jgi:hypothetical protein